MGLYARNLLKLKLLIFFLDFDVAKGEGRFSSFIPPGCALVSMYNF